MERPQTSRLRALQQGLATGQPRNRTPTAAAPAALVEFGAPTRFNSRRSPIVSMHGVAASSEPLVTAAGLRVMMQGGNAADAAVAMAAAINMTEPCMTGIGGDCFCLFFDAKTGQVKGLNGSGRCAKALTLDVVAETIGYRYPERYRLPSPGERGIHHTVTVPGAAAGWCDTVAAFGSGKLDLLQVLTPGIELGEGGFPVHKLTARQWQGALALLRNAETAPGGTQHLKRGGDGKWRGPHEGEVWYNKNLARTFRTLAAEGKEGFYAGRVGQAIVDVLAGMGGVLSMEDLAEHCERGSTYPEPIKANYRGVDVWEIPPNGQVGLYSIVTFQYSSTTL
jgi:gamma-glutamyltranspeptidase/glutathione hydrolase